MARVGWGGGFSGFGSGLLSEKVERKKRGGQRKEFVEEGKEEKRLVGPAFERGDAVAVVFGFAPEGPGLFSDAGFDPFDEAGISLQMRPHRFVESTAEESPHFCLGFVEGAAVPGNIDLGNG